MNYLTRLNRTSTVLFLTLLGCTLGILATRLHAANDAPQQPAASQQVFATPDEAIKALQAAAQANDREALRKLFGPEFPQFQTGDPVQDANNAKRFAAQMAQSSHLVNEGANTVSLEVGSDNWPFPIPLVKADGQWHFDTAAGKQVMIDRHIGKDELHAIGFCRAYVEAQMKYATMNLGSKYALHIKSEPGKKDGLYWPPASNEPASPFGPLLTQAQAEGYSLHARGTALHPFHGYYFRILTRQGAAAPGGKMDYLSHGKLTDGFALVAYPERWGESGIMTFIVNQDGKVYQRDFGVATLLQAGSLNEYNPDSDWTLVEDKGVLTETAISHDTPR